MMTSNLARVETATLVGLEPLKIEVEIESLSGMPGLTIIGLPTESVREAKDRIVAALVTCGIRLPAKKIILNLAPADVKKTGSGLELAMAMAILKVFGELQISEKTWQEETKGSMFFGELALDGRIKAINGCLPLVLAASEMQKQRVFVSEENYPELASISRIEIVLVRDLTSLIEYFRHEGQENSGVRIMKAKKMIAVKASAGEEEGKAVNKSENKVPDMSDIRGQVLAKRALEIAAAGGHNVFLIGTPGSGKSMMAQALTGILPPPSDEEIIEISKIYSICGLSRRGLMTRRPFRSPHHSISAVGMIGGSAQLKPGEITLAHRGVLFLDEFPEFSRVVLEALRQPLEVGVINIARASGQATFPARFTLVAAANPCPCGYFGSRKKDCQCSPSMRQNYRRRISGPILDRIDMHWRVNEVELNELTQKRVAGETETSAEIKARVTKACNLQKEKLQKWQTLTNSELSSQQVLKICVLSRDAERLLQAGAKKMNLSARSYFKIIKVAQTIADLAGSETIDQGQIAEAMQYQQLEDS